MKKPDFNRRNFLKRSSVGLLGAGMLGNRTLNPIQEDPDDDPPKIKGYKTLGRTGFKASDISLGNFHGIDSIPRAALNAGINLIETSEQYDSGNLEKSIGRTIQDFNREDLFLLTKISLRQKWETAEVVTARAEASMERLQTDYLDCYMIHGALSSDMVKNEAFHKAMDKMHKDGRIRFRGISCHGHSWRDNPRETFEDVLMAAIEDGRFDVILLSYNFLEREMGGRVLEAAKKNNIGTLAMKTNPIYWYEYADSVKKGIEEKGDTISETVAVLWQKFKEQTRESEQFFSKYGYESMEELKDAVIQYVLGNPDLHSICMRFRDFASFEKNVRLSGTTLDDGKQAMLDDFREMYGPLQCRTGCNLCESACPHHIPVGTIMRYSYYFHAQQREKYAMQQYRELPGPMPDVCLNCEGYCQEACPHGVQIQGLLSLAHQSLIFDDAYLT